MIRRAIPSDERPWDYFFLVFFLLSLPWIIVPALITVRLWRSEHSVTRASEERAPVRMALAERAP